MKSRKRRSVTSRDEFQREYALLKMMLREVGSWVRTTAEMRETIQRISAMLDEMNKKSVIFWTEFKRDFPETWDAMNVNPSFLE
jgi:hypothetical protein